MKMNPKLLSVLIGIALTVTGWCWAEQAAPSLDSAKFDGRPTSSVPPVNGGLQSNRRREGAKVVDQIGQFRLTGDRATFYGVDGTLQLPALENLCLERIVRAVVDNPNRVQWVVSGTITEYRDGNFLLISHAAIRQSTDAVPTER